LTPRREIDPVIEHSPPGVTTLYSLEERRGEQRVVAPTGDFKKLASVWPHEQIELFLLDEAQIIRWCSGAGGVAVAQRKDGGR
jgi:hypothetical protein